MNYTHFPNGSPIAYILKLFGSFFWRIFFVNFYFCNFFVIFLFTSQQQKAAKSGFKTHEARKWQKLKSHLAWRKIFRNFKCFFRFATLYEFERVFVCFFIFQAKNLDSISLLFCFAIEDKSSNAFRRKNSINFLAYKKSNKIYIICKF